MECHMMGTTSCCLDNYLNGFPWQSRNLNWEKFHRFQCDVAAWRSRMGSRRLTYPNLAYSGKNSMCHVSWRTFSMALSLEEESSSPQLEDNSSNDKDAPTASPEELLEKPWGSDELKAWLSDSERVKLIKKLSEANQQNRFLKRQLHIKEDALVNFKRELAVMELEIQALVALAEEIAKSGIPEGSRKINGKYIQSHLFSWLEGKIILHDFFGVVLPLIKPSRSRFVQLLPYGGPEVQGLLLTLIRGMLKG